MDSCPKLDLVLTCTGRTASGFYAKYLTSAGIRCGHERFFTPYGYNNAIKKMRKQTNTRAESAWEAAPWLDSEALKDAFVVHLIRDPEDTIESWMRQPTESIAPLYWDYAASYCPRMDELEYPIDRYAYRYVAWNRMIEDKLVDRDYVRFDVAREPRELLEILKEKGFLEKIRPDGALFGNREHNKHGRAEVRFKLSLIHEPWVREELDRIATDYGYEWFAHPAEIITPVVKAVITTLDNCDLLQRQIAVLDVEPIDEIVVVNNGSEDGTQDWLSDQQDLVVVNRDNCGAGPGRNSGLDAAGKFDYVLMLDGGILPAFGTIDKMLTWLQPRPGIIGIGVEVDDLRTDYSAAWNRWTEHISRTYVNNCLSHTAYGLFSWKAWDGLRFTEDGPFGMQGWGADDNEMRYQWLDAGLDIHVVTCGCRLPYFKGKCIGGSVHAYRRAGGSWSRIKRETGIEPWGEGSVYEQRCVWLQHNWPQYSLGEQRDEPWFTMVIKAADTWEETAQMIKVAHSMLYRRKLAEPGRGKLPNPYSIILWINDASEDVVNSADHWHLRRHYSRTTTIDGRVVHLNEQNSSAWTGDFRLSYSDDWHDDLRQRCYLYGYAETIDGVREMISAYNTVLPNRPKMGGPAKRRLAEKPPARYRRKRIELG